MERSVKAYLFCVLFLLSPLLAVPQRAGWGATREQTLQQQSSNIAVKVVIASEPGANTDQPKLKVTIQNLGDEEISFPSVVLIHIEGSDGEPPTTLRQRQLDGTMRKGEPGIDGGGFEPPIAPHAEFTRTYALKSLYDLSAPGGYRVYADVLDELSSKQNAGVWVRSESLHLQVP